MGVGSGRNQKRVLDDDETGWGYMLAMIDVWVRVMRKLVFYILVLLVLTLTEFMIMMISITNKSFDDDLLFLFSFPFDFA